MTAMEVFAYDGQQVRTVMDEVGEPWFVAADVALILGYRKASDMARVIPDEDKGAQIVGTPGGDQQMVVLSEPGLYGAIIQRQSGYIDDPGARESVRKFQRWVTHEVLPAIRKTGSYSNIPKTYSEALRELASSVEARELAEARAKELEGPAAAWTRLASASGDYSLNQAAKILSRDPGIEIGERRLFTALEALNWVYRDRRYGGNGAWTAYQAAIDCGRLVHRTRSHEHPHTGVIVLDAPQVRVTVKGLADLHKHLGGIEPLAKSLPSNEPAVSA